MMNEATVRGAAVRSLSALVRHGKYSNLEVNSALSGSRFGDADRRLYTTLVYGVVERIPTLDYIISVLSSRPVDTI
ncbi:MAG: 16S rRNA (cytosine(967)-C(5))-methyltransferase RsmB, partial [Clostridia bacterium]|nr:16S rRNA (cytosine(967)-C(5))-methyltransferase RsmB [Clostridia bacterium]